MDARTGVSVFMNVVSAVAAIVAVLAAGAALFLLMISVQTAGKGWEGQAIVWFLCGVGTVVAVLFGGVAALLWFLAPKKRDQG